MDLEKDNGMVVSAMLVEEKVKLNNGVAKLADAPSTVDGL